MDVVISGKGETLPFQLKRKAHSIGVRGFDLPISAVPYADAETGYPATYTRQRFTDLFNATHETLKCSLEDERFTVTPERPHSSNTLRDRI